MQKCGLVIYRESFDTYARWERYAWIFQFRPILQQLLSIGRIQVKLDLQYQKVSGFLVVRKHYITKS